LLPTNKLSFLINRVLLTQTPEVSTLAMDGVMMVSSFSTRLRKFARTERPMVKYNVAITGSATQNNVVTSDNT
jgi:hypothetical protein